MITMLDDPSYELQTSPSITSRLLATECPNNFRLQRKDFLITDSENAAGSPEYMMFTLASEYTGTIGNSVSVYNSTDGLMYTGTVLDIASPASVITVDIAYSATFEGAYLNDNTLYAGYYFEGRLTVNGTVQELTLIASPDSFGKADIDVSGVLRIMTSMDKQGDYSAIMIAETSKSGSFTFAYRGCWYGSDEAYAAEGNTWYYTESIRSAEQGGNLYEYLYEGLDDAQFLNSFEQPTYFRGFPFDVSFFLPADAEANVSVIIRFYNAGNAVLSSVIEVIDTAVAPAAKGRMNSINVQPASIPATAAYMTIEVVGGVADEYYYTSDSEIITADSEEITADMEY